MGNSFNLKVVNKLGSKLYFSASVSILAAIAAGPAFAQATPAAEPDKEQVDNAVPEIVVTAEKRSESVMKTGIAVSALSGQDIRAKEIVGAADLQNFAPSLSITNNGLTNNVNIRGIGLNVTTPAVTSGVAMYRDNLYQAPIVAGEPYYDIANIQVLRGPQGTFVGSNSTGGAVFISTISPKIEDEVHGYVTAKAGTYSSVGVEGAVNVPVSDTIAVRTAFYTDRRDSFYKNLTPNPGGAFRVLPSPGNLNTVAARVGLLWQPSSSFEMVAKVEYYQNHTGGFALKPIPGTPLAAFAPNKVFELAYAIPNTRYDEYDIRADVEAKYTFPGGVALRSVSGVTVYDYKQVIDATASTQPSQNVNNQGHERVYSQELNLLSPDSGRFKWVIGVYGFYDPTKVRALFQNFAGIGPATTPTTNLDITADTAKWSIAGFGGIRYNLTDKFELQASGRYTYNQVTNFPAYAVDVYLTSGPGTPAAPFFAARVPINGKHSDHGATWKVALNWTPDHNNLIYGFVATGMKSGGVQDPNTNFEPEHVTDYEIGWKATMLGGRLRTQIGGFYNNYTNLQISDVVPSSGQSSLFNAGHATLYGVEGEMDLRLGALTVSAVASYVHTKLSIAGVLDAALLPDAGAGTLGPQCAAGQTSGCFDYTPFVASSSASGLPYAPKYNFSVGASYAFEVGARSTLTPRIDVSQTGSQWTEIFHHPIGFLPGRTLVNAKLSLVTSNWTVEAYSTNLFGEVYPAGRAGTAWFYGAPRQVGLRVSRSF